MKQLVKFSKGMILALALSLIPAAAQAAGETGEITGDRVNLRTGPSLGYSSLGHLYKGDTVTVNGEENGWYAVTAKGTDGYVSKAYVSIKADTEDGGSNNAGSTGSAQSSVMKRGDKSSKVKTLQGNLIYLGYLNDTADGVFGGKTETAVRLYQRRNGLAVDGVVGTSTNSAIQKEVLRVIDVVETAKKYLGTPYVTAGSTPETGFDCSGLTQYAHRQAGISIPRVSYEQAKAGIAVPRSQMRAGDLVAFNSPVSHVGIYLGNGKFIHSPKPGDKVKITDLKYMNLTAVRRFTGVLVNG